MANHRKPMKTNTTSMLRILLIGILAALTSCQNPANTQKAVAIGELGLNLLVAKKVLKPEDAELARQTGQLLITPAAPVEVTSGK
jgi:hypothetical protein